MTSDVPFYRTIALERTGRILTIVLNRPDCLNAFDKTMHDEFPDALSFARDDAASDVIVLTGRGRAFSAGGDLAHIIDNARQPERFDHEIAMARRIVETLIDIDKPVVCRLNGHAIGLGATLALLCDFVFAAEEAKIGDPHVNIGLVAGDGGVIAWPQRIGLTRAKEYLMLGEAISAQHAADIGLVNRCLPFGELDNAVDDVCRALLSKPQFALRKTKQLTNLELKRLAASLLDQGLAWESQSVRDPDHMEAVVALGERREPRFTQH